jgi:hypothetical protein
MAWCYVDPDDCDLQVRPSVLYRNSRFYSYATCGYPDVFVNDFTNGAKRKPLRIGLNHNSGGWMGAFHSTDGTHFAGPLSDWKGPAVEFIKEASARGNLSIEVVVPPAFLINGSYVFFGNSQFDLCVYATSLGYLDMCVASYFVTEKRATTADWLVLNSQDLYLITIQEGFNETTFASFTKNTGTIFQAFKPEVWTFVSCFVIPLFGILMVTHERAQRGSAFPTHENVMETDNETGEKLIKERRIPLYSDVSKSIYISFLSVVQMGWGQSVVSLGGHLNLIGIAFFILTFLAVYTANLAAILTKRRKTTAVASIDEAVKASLKVCADRSIVDLISGLYDISDHFFVKDPVDEGGDGKPGFACPNCNPRKRSFDFIDPSRTKKKEEIYDERYCDFAIAALEDLEAFQAESVHCDKTAVGKPVAQPLVGMPIFEQRTAEILPLLLEIRNSGFIDSTFNKERPKKLCRDFEVKTGGETASLDMTQLTGIWFITFGLSIFSFLVTWAHRCRERRKKKHVMPIMGRDQMGEKINLLERGDSFVWERVEVDEETGRMMVTEAFNLTNDRAGHRELLKGVTNTVKGVAGKAKNVAGKAKEVAKDVAGRAKDVAKEVAEKAKDVAEKAKDVAEGVAEKAKDVAGKALELSKSHLPTGPSHLISVTNAVASAGDVRKGQGEGDSGITDATASLSQEASLETPISQKSMKLIDLETPGSMKGGKKKKKKTTKSTALDRSSQQSLNLIDLEEPSIQRAKNSSASEIHGAKTEVKKKKHKTAEKDTDQPKKRSKSSKRELDVSEQMQQSTNSTKLGKKKATKSPNAPNSGKVRKDKKEYDTSLAPQIPFLDQFDPETSDLALRDAFEMLVASEDNQPLDNRSPLRDQKPSVKRRKSKSRSRENAVETFQDEDA